MTTTPLSLDNAMQLASEAFLPCGCVTSANPEDDSFGFTVMNGSGEELARVAQVRDYADPLRMAQLREQALTTQREHDRMLLLSQTDPLTGLLNRRGLQLALGHATRAFGHAAGALVGLAHVDQHGATVAPVLQPAQVQHRGAGQRGGDRGAIRLAPVALRLGRRGGGRGACHQQGRQGRPPLHGRISCP